jgi:predicted nucleic acid-binding protein
MMRGDRFAEIDEPGGLNASWRELSATLQPGAGLGTDVYLGAFARAAGLEIVTFDRGFQRFPGLEVRLL